MHSTHNSALNFQVHPTSSRTNTTSEGPCLTASISASQKDLVSVPPHAGILPEDGDNRGD